MYVRAIELREAVPVRVATIDLRAWVGRSEFLFHVLWAHDSMTLRALLPDEISHITATGFRVRPLPNAM
jgi:hypothetical protein